MTSEIFRRGQRIISADDAATRAKRLLAPDDFGLVWGGITLPSADASTHFCAVGGTRSGKTMLLRLLMQSCLPLIGASFKSKPYKVSHRQVTEPTLAEWETYNAAIKAYEAAVSDRDSQVRASNQAIAVVQRLNESIRSANRKLRTEVEEASARVKGINDELAAVQYSDRSTTHIKIALILLPIVAFFSPRISGGQDWQFQIGVQIGFAIAFGLLLRSMVIISAQRDAFNDRLKTRSEELKEELGQFQESLARLKGMAEETELAEPKPLWLPTISAPTAHRPYPTTTYVEEEIKPKPDVGGGHRAIIYDAKGDLVSLLYGMSLECDIKILNPFDKRSHAWNLAADITTPANARQLATILIPENKNASQPFFGNAARDIVTHLILALGRRKPSEWSLRDLVLATQSKGKLIDLLRQTPQGATKVEAYFSESVTGNSILSEIVTHMAQFESVAEAWHHTGNEPVSLADWIQGEESILVLGSNEEHRDAINPINRVLLQRATELALAQTESTTRRTWFFLDEVRDLKDLESLGRLMTKGGSKGVSVVLAFQDIQGMHDGFGKERSNEFVGQCATKAILRLNSPDTAKWASDLFGKYEFMEDELSENTGGSKTTGTTDTYGDSFGETTTKGTTKGTNNSTSKGTTNSEGTNWGTSTTDAGDHMSHSNQKGGNEGNQRSVQTSEGSSSQESDSRADQESWTSSKAENSSDTDSWTKTVNHKRMEKDAILSSQFTNIPLANQANGLGAYYSIPSVGAFYGTLTGEQVDRALTQADTNEPNYLPRDSSEQFLTGWSDKEWDELVPPEFRAKTGKNEDPKYDQDEGSEPESRKANQQISEKKLADSRPSAASTEWLPRHDNDSGLSPLQE